MPNSILLKLVIHTSTMNSAHCALRDVRPRRETPAPPRGAARATPSKISALASRAASAAAASASISVVAVLLPSAMVRLLEESADTRRQIDRKSTRLNSSHLGISYAVF